ncbi:MAG: hypothetical protein GY835_16725 [bacterium]|nr:hypothetical protein [bacterium]
MLYDHSNRRFMDECQALFSSWERTLGKKTTLSLELGREACSIQSHRLDHSEFKRSMLIQIMRTLGIARLEIASSISLVELHGFVNRFLHLKNEVEAAHSFKQYEFRDLPEAIIVKQRRIEDQSLAESQRLTRLELVDEAVEQVLNTSGDDACPVDESITDGTNLKMLFTEIADRYEHQHQSGDSKNQALDSLADILKLGVDALHHGFEQTSADDEYETMLDAALNAEELAGSSATQAMISDILRDTMLNGSGQKGVDEDIAAVSCIDDFEHPIDALLHELEASDDSLESFFELQPEDNAEQLSLLLQMMFKTSSMDEFKVAAGEVTELLSNALNMRESQVLVSALDECLDKSNISRVDLVLPCVLSALAEANSRLLIKVYQELAPGSSEGELEALWPYLVNEILVDCYTANSKSRKQLYRLASSLPAKGMERAVKRLESLPVLVDDACSRQLLDSLIPELGPVYAALLTSSRGDEFGERIFRSLRRKPCEGLAPIALEVMGTYCLKNREFFVCALQAGHDAEAKRALRRKTAFLLREAIEDLLPRERRFPWVSEAITSLGGLGVEEMSGTLSRIRSERRFGLFPVWPRRCRNAAKAGLSS